MADDQRFRKTMASVIRECLKANLENSLPEPIFQKLAASRVSLAFALMQCLITAAPNSDDAKSIIEPAFLLVNSQDFDIATCLTGDNAPYIRVLLRILCLSLEAHLQKGQHRRSKQSHAVASGMESLVKTDSKVESVVLEILGSIAARGFRSLISLLHEDSTKVRPEDFGLITAIMRTALQVPGISSYSERLLTYFEDERTVQYASTLLSWSHHLMDNRDPLYGELSMTFLTELSNMPVLAESVAVGGTFGQITTATLFNYFRRPGGTGPFDEPTRMFNIWTRGFLPFVINLLSAIGPPIAVEISNTLKMLEPQISRASTSFGVKLSSQPPGPTTGYITLSMAGEAHSLALLWVVLNRFRESGSSLGIITTELLEMPWDAAGVREDLESRFQRRNHLRNSIVPTDDREQAWSRQKPLRIGGGSENKLEEKVVGEMRAALALLGNTEF